jgi:hypothetical protein
MIKRSWGESFINLVFVVMFVYIVAFGLISFWYEETGETVDGTIVAKHYIPSNNGLFYTSEKFALIVKIDSIENTILNVESPDYYILEIGDTVKMKFRTKKFLQEKYYLLDKYSSRRGCL